MSDKPSDEAMAVSAEWMEKPALALASHTRIEVAIMLDAFARRAVEAERERVLRLLAPYAWHAYNCPKMNDHACTCGMAEVRIELWGKDERPAPEPMVKLHECYAKPPKKVRDRMAKRNAT